MSLNSVTLSGRLGQNAEIRHFESGKAIANFSLAVDKPRSEQPDWIRCKYWLKEGSRIQEFLVQGQLIGIQGRLEVERWVDRENAKRQQTVVVVTRVELLGSKKEEPEQQQLAGIGAVVGASDWETPDF